MIDQAKAVSTLLALLRIEALSGREQPVAEFVIAALVRAGCKQSWISSDTAHRRIKRGFERGNLIIKLPGSRPGPRLLFSAHLDTVPLCRGAAPARKSRRIVPRGKTALGADDRAGVACLVTVADALLRKKLPHPPLTFLFTVGEEVGLLGAKFVSSAKLGRPEMGFNYDGGAPNEVEIGAVGADRWEVLIHGLSSHAGVAPEKGISAALILGKAVAEIERRRRFGKIAKGPVRGTSNIGIVRGGEATNQVLDELYVKGESSSHDPRFLDEITRDIRRAFERAAASVKNSSGQRGSCEFRCERSYAAFKLDKHADVIKRTKDAMRRSRLRPRLTVSNGGLDANYFNALGIPTVTLGAGAHNPHTISEYAAIDEYLTACKLGVEIARGH